MNRYRFIGILMAVAIIFLVWTNVALAGINQSSLTPVNFLAQTNDSVGDVLTEPSLFENWQFVLAFILPLAIAFIIKRDWTQQQKALASFTISAICAIVGMLIAGTLPVDADIQVKLIGALTTILKVFAL